ncbi:beta-lactamase/transpeptidase-like protein [Chaetomidium leptoderma]|uniref:Beta-lactamase/transpeptidase-like protein n=1 Tax=Chaetomidium leptoderma TaxID=669021 RepID=A0AAN6ZWJ1_9PEZI|nr:beta-lactamase/transpeptidase-like protein [Chaetomidium leptoderma]
MVKLVHLLLGLPVGALAQPECRPEGPVFPRPRNLNKSKPFRSALDKLTTTLDGAFNGKIRTSMDGRNVSVSVAIVGLDQKDASTPLWEYHHLGSGNVNGTKKLDRHSQYLIGSVSKVLSDAIFIRSGLNMDDAVTKYLPSLDNKTSLIDWENISLRALGGQLSGIPPNYGFSEYHYLNTLFEALGFPHLDDSSYPPCGVTGLSAGCTKAQNLEGMLTSRPIARPQSRPVYSNIAYTILAYAIEAATGKDYATALHDLVTAPLHMPSTAPSPGNDDRAVIPPVDSSWGSDYGANAPGGGLVSTLADMTAFLHAILTRNPALATPTQIHEWLQPRSFAGSRSSFVGLPWEIFRPAPSVLFPHTYDSDAATQEEGGGGHSVTIHAKDGAAYGYHARVALLDEYGVGLVVLTAGGGGQDSDALTEVYDAALSVLVPAADDAARAVGREQYAGHWWFKGQSTREETGRVPVEARTEMDGVSLKLTGLRRNGTDILQGLKQMWGVTLSTFVPSKQVTGVFRLYPADVERTTVLPGGKKVVEEDWRLWWETENTLESDMPGKGISDHDCLSWTLADWIHYGSESVDRVVFVKDAKTGEVLSLDVPFLRTSTMKKWC